MREKAKLLPLIEEYRKLMTSRKSFPSQRSSEMASIHCWRRLSRHCRRASLFSRRSGHRSAGALHGGGDYSRADTAETGEEIPYATTVVIESFEEGARLTRIAATIYCEREGQKGILVGKGGQMLKKIGTAARLQIEKMVGTKVFLELYVKAAAGLARSRSFVEELDWRRQFEQRMLEQESQALTRAKQTSWSCVKTNRPNRSLSTSIPKCAIHCRFDAQYQLES